MCQFRMPKITILDFSGQNWSILEFYRQNDAGYRMT